MENLPNKLKSEFLSLIDLLSKKNQYLYIALPEYNILPDEIKFNFIYPITCDIFNFLEEENDLLLDYILRFSIMEKTKSNEFIINKHQQTILIQTLFNTIKQYLDNLEKEILQLSNKLNNSLMKYNVSRIIENELSDYISPFLKIEINEFNSNYFELKREYESLSLKALKLIKNLEKHLFEKIEPSEDIENSVVAMYINFNRGRKSFIAKLFNKPILPTITPIISKNIDFISKYLNYGPKSYIKNKIKSILGTIRVFILKVITDAFVFYCVHNQNIEISDMLRLADMKSNSFSLEFVNLEIDYSEMTLRDNNITMFKEEEFKRISFNYSLSKQDKDILNYVNNPPFSISLNKKKFSLFNGINFVSGFFIIFVFIIFLTLNFLLPRTQLLPITERVSIIQPSQNIHSKDLGNNFNLDDLMLSSLSSDGSNIDEEFISEIKLTISTGIEKQKNIRQSIMHKISENEEFREFIPFDELANEDNQNDNSNELSSTNKEENSNVNENLENEANKVKQPLSLPDYSEYVMSIEPHNIDFSIKERIFTQNDFKNVINKLNRRFNDWYEQTEEFFAKYEIEYEIAKAHQKKFLGFIQKLNPVKIFEAYNYIYQNYPYLIDRVIKDDMPVIYTAVSTDARELGLWSSSGIGIFYDISSFDVFQQTLMHELTHDLIQRVYGTPIILEGITEMLAMSISSYLYGEGFSNYKGPVRVALYLYNRNSKAVIDYYIGRRVDDNGKSIDLFYKSYIIHNFLSDEVNDALAQKNTDLINSMLDIPFNELIQSNQSIINLNKIINTHKDSIPLVLQADFNCEGLSKLLITSLEAIENLDKLILPKLKVYIEKEKKIDVYTIVSIENTIKLIKKNNPEYIRKLNTIESVFSELKREIKNKNLIFEQNVLSKKSIEIFKQNITTTYSDKDYQDKIDKYKDDSNSLQSSIEKDFRENISNDQKEIIQEEIKRHIETSKTNNISNEEFNDLISTEISKDIESFTNLLKEEPLTSEYIIKEYNNLLNKWGPLIEEKLRESLHKFIEGKSSLSIDNIIKLPNERELLKKRFNLMEDAIRNDNEFSNFYYYLDDNVWFELLSYIAEEEYTLRYYRLIIDKLIELPNFKEINIEKTLTNLKRIISYINTIKMLNIYKEDLISIINSVTRNPDGISKLNDLNRYIAGTVHTYIKSEVIFYLDNFIIDYVDSYPEEDLDSIFSSGLLKILNPATLYQMLEKAISLNIDISLIQHNILMYSELYLKIDISNLTEKFITLYSRQIKSKHDVYFPQDYLTIIYNTEQILIDVFCKKFIDSSSYMIDFYNKTIDILKTKLDNFQGKSHLIKYLNMLSEKEKYIAYFNLAVSLSGNKGNVSFDSFIRSYNGIFLNQINLYDNFSEDFLYFIIEMGFIKIYENNVFSIIENSYQKDSFYDELWNPKKTLMDYIALIENDESKKKLTEKLIDFLEFYFKNNYIDNMNTFFVIGSTLNKYINKSSYFKLIKIRFKIRGKTFPNIPMETEILFLILNMIVNNPLIIDEFDAEIKKIIATLLYQDEIGSLKDFGLTNLFIKQIELIDNIILKSNLETGSSYQISKILFYESNITGMLIEFYNYIYKNNINIKLINHILNIYGLYIYQFCEDLLLYSKYRFEMNQLLVDIFQKSDYRSINIINKYENLLSDIEKSILDDPTSNFYIFYILAFEDWFWNYYTKNNSQKDSFILLLAEKPLQYGKTFHYDFVSSYINKIISDNVPKNREIKLKLLTRRDLLLPFFISKDKELRELFITTLIDNNKNGITFLFRLIAGNYLSSSSYLIDFFVEGELIRSFLRSIFLENYSYYEKLYFALPDKPIEQFGYEEELRRSLVNMHYHIFQTIPQNKKILLDLLDIYKKTANDLLQKLINNGNISKDRLEEEFSKISNIVYLINDEKIKYETAEIIYPLIEIYVEYFKNTSDYIFANYVKENVSEKTPQLKWNILDSIKSTAFNYKEEVDRNYKKLFYNIPIEILISYRDYLSELIKKGQKIQLTEYKVLLEIITKNKSQKAIYGLDLLENTYKKMYNEAKNEKFLIGNEYDSDIKNIIVALKNLISYSSSTELIKTKKNISIYSKEISAIFRNLISKSITQTRYIRTLVSEMAKEIVKLPIQDRIAIFSIFSNIIIDYSAVNYEEYKYYTTLMEYLIENIFQESNPDQYSKLSNIMENIAALIIYLNNILENENEGYNIQPAELTKKYYSLMVMYSYYLNLADISNDSNSINEYIIKLYSSIKQKLSKEEDAIITSNIIKLVNDDAKNYINKYMKTPIFRRYLEEINELDRKIIFEKTQEYINWISSIKIDYDNPLSNNYLIEMFGIKDYVNKLVDNKEDNISISIKLLKWKNKYVSTLVNFFSETYGYNFKDPARTYQNSF